MSEQVRFKIEGCKVNPDLASICITFVKDENGEYVRYEDYARLKAEVERLRKAGYAMAVKINVHGIADKFTDSQKLVDDWSAAAKEGKQS